MFDRRCKKFRATRSVAFEQPEPAILRAPFAVRLAARDTRLIRGGARPS